MTPTYKIHIMAASGFDIRRDNNVVRWRKHGHDTGTEVCVHDDAHHDGVLSNYADILRCASCTPADTHPSDWHLVLQDDATPLPGWTDELPPALAHAPADCPFVCLSHPGPHGQRLVRQGIPYATGPNLVWGPAAAYRSGFDLDDLAEFVAQVHSLGLTRARQWDDPLPAIYNVHVSHPDPPTQTALTARSLFGWLPDTPSTLGHRTDVNQPLTGIDTTATPRWDAIPASRPLNLPFSPSMEKAVQQLRAHGVLRSTVRS